MLEDFGRLFGGVWRIFLPGFCPDFLIGKKRALDRKIEGNVAGHDSVVGRIFWAAKGILPGFCTAERGKAI